MVDTKFLQVCKHEEGLKSEIIILRKILKSNTTWKFDQIKDIMIFVFCRKTTELSGFLNVYGRNVIALTLWCDLVIPCFMWDSKTPCRKLGMAVNQCGSSEGSKT